MVKTFHAVKKLIKKFLPPILLEARGLLRTPKTDLNEVTWRGNYKTWEEAAADSTGYDADIILEKTAAAITKVRNNEAVYERDSVIFDKPDYSWPLLAWLFKIGIQKDNSIDVVDFGGSLGSSYYQTRDFLKPLKLVWSVVEQEHYVSLGREKFSDDQLKFYYTVEECLGQRPADVLLLSGVIQCIDNPYEWLSKFLGHKFQYIILDRTAFINGVGDRLTVQDVPASIYKASYPAWFFDYRRFVAFFNDTYEIVSEFDSHPGYVAKIGTDATGHYKGLVLKRRE